MKIKLDKKYLMYIVYICLTATVIFISYNIIFNVNTMVASIVNLTGFMFNLLSPLIIGITIAYLLFPITKGISYSLAKIFKLKNKPYFISVLLTYICVLLFLILLIYAIYVLIGGQITGHNNISMMITSIRGYLARYNELFEYISKEIAKSGLSVDLKSYLNEGILKISNYVNWSFGNVFEFLKGFSSSIINGFLGFIISFYLLKDYEFFKKVYMKIMLLIFNIDKIKVINDNAKEIDNVISKFIRGQLLDGLIVGLLSSVGLIIIGMDFAFLIGFTAGMANIIPYIGPVVGCIPAIIVGLLSPNPIIALWAVVVFIVVQQIDGMIISPKIVGDSTGLHPVFVIMAIAIGGSLGGILGMFLSVPILGVIKLFISKYLRDQ